MRKRVGIALAVLLVASIVAFGVSWYLNVFVFDDYDAYGEVPIPGTRTLHLPQGDVKVTFHTEIAGSMEGGEVPTPQDLEVTIAPPSGVAQPEFTRKIGGTTGDNQDMRRPVGVARIPTAGDYTVTANGKANAFISPRLSFGHGSNYRFVPGFFLWLGVLSLAALAALPFVGQSRRPAVRPKPKTPLRRLEDIASLHDSGALSDEEYEAEKRRILDDS